MGRRTRGTSPNEDSIGSGNGGSTGVVIGSRHNSSTTNKKSTKHGKKKNSNAKHHNDNNNNNNNNINFSTSKSSKQTTLDSGDLFGFGNNDTISILQYGFMIVMLLTSALMLITFNLMQNTNSFGSTFPGMVNHSPHNYNHGSYHQQQQYHSASSGTMGVGGGAPSSSSGSSYHHQATPSSSGLEDIPMPTAATHGYDEHQHNNRNSDDHHQLHYNIHDELTSTALHYYPMDLHLNQAVSISPKPKLCSDGVSYGYSDWYSLRSAVHSLNEGRHNHVAKEVMHNNAKRYTTPYDNMNVVGAAHNHDMHHHHHHHLTDSMSNPHNAGGIDIMTDAENDELLYFLHNENYEPPTPFTICPGITIRGRNRHGPIYINTEDTIIECDACIIDIGGTHFTFGPHARGVVIRGITLMGAKSSSLTFHAHGADVTFEDCTWIGNSGLSHGGAVADLNSTSSVSFFRCEISDSKQSPRVAGGHGGYGGSVIGGNSVVGSSLTIRN